MSSLPSSFLLFYSRQSFSHKEQNQDVFSQAQMFEQLKV